MPTNTLFPLDKLCGNCRHMDRNGLDPMHGRCPKLGLWVTERAKACRTYYEQEVEASGDLGLGE